MRFATRSPDSFWADRALWVAATTLLWNAPDEGIALLERLVAEYPQSQYRPEAPLPAGAHPDRAWSGE